MTPSGSSPGGRAPVATVPHVRFSLLPDDASELRSSADQLAVATSQLEAADLDAFDGDDPGALGRAVDHRATVRHFCEEHPDALHRSCLTGHLTGSAAIVDDAGSRVLLIHHTKLDRWLQPGGHADGEGALALVARTEAEEETGLRDLRVVWPAVDVDVHEIPQLGDTPPHRHLDLRFAVVAPADAVISADPTETKGARWFLPDEVAAVDPEGELTHLVRRALSVVRSLR